MNSSTSEGIEVHYDGECPLCSRYVRYTRLAAALGPVKLCDLREEPETRRAFIAQGHDPDRGMVVRYRGQLYGGPEALTLLALHTTRSGLFNHACAWTFAAPWRARLLYPLLRAGRRIALWLKGRPLLSG